MYVIAWAAILSSLASASHIVELQYNESSGENLILGEYSILELNYSHSFDTNITLIIRPQDTAIAQILDSCQHILPACNYSISECRIEGIITALQVGRTNLIFTFEHPNHSAILTNMVYYLPVTVIVEPSTLKVALTYITTGLLLVINFLMGCQIEWTKVKEVFRRPVAVLIGLGCQILLMPLLAFGLVNAFLLPDNLALGLLIVGTAPGGGISNAAAMITDGDLDLSASMTVISSTLAFGVMPLWLFTYGRFFAEADLLIPYGNIALSLSFVVVPLFLGVLFQHKKPSWSKKFVRIGRPSCLIIILIMIALSIYTNLHVFSMLSWQSVIPAILLPICGMLIGALVAYIFQQDIAKIKTISWETGVQNTILSIAVVQLSYSSPDSDIMFVMPGSVIMGTFFIVLLMSTVHICLKKFSVKYHTINMSEATSGQKSMYVVEDKMVSDMIYSGEIILKQNVMKNDEQVADIPLKPTKNAGDFSNIWGGSFNENDNIDKTVPDKLSDKVVNVDDPIEKNPVTKSCSTDSKQVIIHIVLNTEKDLGLNQNFEEQTRTTELSDDDNPEHNKTIIKPNDKALKNENDALGKYSSAYLNSDKTSDSSSTNL